MYQRFSTKSPCGTNNLCGTNIKNTGFPKTEHTRSACLQKKCSATVPTLIKI